MRNTWNLMQERPALTENEKKYKLSELYYRELTGPEAEVLYGIEYGKEMDPSQAMLDLNELLLPGYPKRENGYCNLPNGGAYVAVRTTYTNGCTPEMYNYWRKWRHDCSPEESNLRFKLWCPGSHNFLTSIPVAGGKDLPAAFTEDLGYGDETLTTTLPIRPSELFDKEQLEKSPVVSIHGGGGTVAGQGSLPYIGLHHLRMIENGFEIRSRFWFGYTIKDRQLEFSNPEKFTLNPEFAYAYAHHVANEMANLRTLLPAVWAAKDEEDA